MFEVSYPSWSGLICVLPPVASRIDAIQLAVNAIAADSREWDRPPLADTHVTTVDEGEYTYFNDVETGKGYFRIRTLA